MELTLFLDHQCNLRCTYCYNGDKFTRAMTEDLMRRAVDMALRTPMPLLDVSFFGGEPLLRLDLVRATVEYVEQQVARLRPRPKVRFIMNTNGTLIDEQAVELMAPPRCWTVFVSIDGTRETHDRFRLHASGAGSYDQVLEGLARLRAASIAFHAVAVVNTATASKLGDAVRSLVPLGPGKVVLAPNLRDDWTDESIEQLRAGLADAGAYWAELFRSGKAMSLEPLHGKILTYLKGGIPCPSRCTIGGNEMTVTPSGRIYPCAQLVGEDNNDDFVIGTIDTGLDPARLQQLQQLKDRVEHTCAPCELRDRCQSHCGCRHVALTGKLGEITATLCEVEAAFIDAADAVAETLYAEQCPAFVDYYYRTNWMPAQGGVLTQLRRSRDA